jgi:hypothetical protein
VHFIGKDIITHHTLFWPAMLHFSGRKVPDRVYVHGHLTVSGEKMSKSRGTGISPLRYLELGMNAEWLRYYIAAKLNARVEDLDFNPDDFVARVNADLVGKYVNIASRAAGFVAKRFGGRLSGDVGVEGRMVLDALRAQSDADRAAVRGARVRQGAARGDGAGRPRQRLRRRAQALGDRQAARPRGGAARRVHGVHRGLPAAHAVPQAGAAGAGGARSRPSCASSRCSGPMSRAPWVRTRSAPGST